MTGDARTNPKGIRPNGTEGDVLGIVGGVAAWMPLVLPTSASPMVSIDENGYPGLIFDEDGNIYRTEG